MDIRDAEEIRKEVRERYAEVAGEKNPSASGCGCGTGCCGSAEVGFDGMAVDLGYSKEQLAQAPEGANMGLGCGNPVALASLRPGEIVLDLGSGGGFDCFLAARAVGENGRVIGVDMTPAMVSRGREIARQEGVKNVEFRLGEIEHLPVSDESIDVIISNCVINLSPEKDGVFREAFRVLKAGGRLAVSDIIATSPLSEEVRKNLSLISACVGGAEGVETLKKLIEKSGFQDVKVDVVAESENFIAKWFPGKGFEGSIASARIEAVKPQGTGKAEEQKAVPDESKEIKKKVYVHYQSGFHCAEVISRALLETFSGKANPEVIKAASAFGGGIAGSTEELCGALTGGIIAIASLLGRENPGDDLRDCGALTNRFKKQFLNRFGSLKCRDILDGFSEKESQIGCVKLTAEASVILSDLVREFERTKGVRLGGKTDLPREKVELGRCPFTPMACSCS